jgi:hypothetical protein
MPVVFSLRYYSDTQLSRPAFQSLYNIVRSPGGPLLHQLVVNGIEDDAFLHFRFVSDPALFLPGSPERPALVASGTFEDIAPGAVLHTFLVRATPVSQNEGSVVSAVEYVHSEWNHYFVSVDPDEIAKLDAGTFPGWRRTGHRFNVYASSGAPGWTLPVCRFLSTAFAPKSSHFYTSSPSECAAVKQNANWHFEGTVFNVPVPTSAGTCPSGTKPIYRSYNNGESGAPNHRLTPDVYVHRGMIAQGWTAEGYGDGVTLCSPVSAQATLCTYSISPTSVTITLFGSGSIAVSAPDDCPWFAQADVSWISLSNSSGSGEGSLNYTVGGGNSPGVGHISVAGQVFTVYKCFIFMGPACPPRP